MAPIRIPEGFVLVPGRSRETATALLAAAEKVGGDRVLDVRTTSGGYHVTAEVAEEYQKAFPDAVIEQDGEVEEVASTDSSELEALPVTENSTHAEIDAYAASLDPQVEFPKDTNKADKIALLEAARQPKTPDAE